jgi:hypothetical protein
MVAAGFAALAFAGVRFYSNGTCNGQQAFFKTEGPNRFGCIEDLTTATGLILSGLSIGFAVLALAFVIIFIKNLSK